MSDFEVRERTIEIKTDGRVEVSPVPTGVEPSMFRHLLAAIDLLYRRNGVAPTLEAVKGVWDFPAGFVEKMLLAPELAQALAIRGIVLDAKTSLTYEQLSAITLLSDPTDRRTTDTKMRSMGVSMAKYRAWMKNPLFSGALHQQAEDNLGDAIPIALNRLVANVEAGDGQAINKILEITGRWNPQQQEIQNARSLVLTFMEVLQAELDPEMLKRVQRKVQDKMQMLALTQSLKD